MNCPACGAAAPDDAIKCSRCGTELTLRAAASFNDIMTKEFYKPYRHAVAIGMLVVVLFFLVLGRC
ncbi:MAG: zinc-ribbon domain-containing protein [candidate division KSB1 bacterium]|nr:zinc-ribbon domain-containing protein [candidate division KSB1 bacterium]